MNSLRTKLSATLMRLGLLGAARRLRRLVMLLVKPGYPRLESEQRNGEVANWERFLRFKRQYGDVLQYDLNSAHDEQKKALVIGTSFPGVETELGPIKGLELAGYEPVGLICFDESLVREYYNLANVREIHSWSEFCEPPDLLDAEAAIEQFGSIEELLTLEFGGAHVGRIAVSTALRKLRTGSLDLQSTQDRQILVGCVASGMAAAAAARRVFRQIRPALALLQDRVYTPLGELFDVCVASGIPAIRWDVAHKNNTLMLKRYAQANRDEMPESLSSGSWQLVRGMAWTDTHREQLQLRLQRNYASEDCISMVGSPYHKRFKDADQIREQLGLNSFKKTAFIFPHILWDASLSYGRDLFRNYEEWFIRTVQAACANDQVNWVIKIHPAHVGKRVKEQFQGEPTEVIDLHRHVGELPPHVFMISPENDISTFSLFKLMDYCLTVRGTVGIEAASYGIPVLTAGTGRYDHKAFTIDSETREEYLGKLDRIQEMPRLSPAQRELAERYAYGFFLLRPLPLETVTVEYKRELAGLPYPRFFETRINAKTKDGWCNAPDMRAFAHWVADSSQPDFLVPVPEQPGRSE